MRSGKALGWLEVRGYSRARRGFTVLELAIVVVVLAGMFCIATFREGRIIGTGILVSGSLLCGALAARNKGRRRVSVALVVCSIVAAGWMARACGKSIQASRPPISRAG